MERRLLNAITTPAAILSLFTGIGLLALEPFYLEQPWMQIKLLFLVIMYGAHGFSIRFRKKLISRAPRLPAYALPVPERAPHRADDRHRDHDHREAVRPLMSRARGAELDLEARTR